MKNPKLVIGIIAIVVLVIILVVVIANSKKVTTKKGGTTVSQAGLGDWIMNLFEPKGTSTSGGGGGGVQNAWCKIFPKSKSCKKPFDCDCENPGYDNSGDLRSSCTEGIGDGWIDQCE